MQQRTKLHLVWLAALVLAAALIWLLGGSLVPFLIGMFLAFLLDPPVRRLEKRGWRRAWAAALATAAVFGLLLAALGALVPVVVAQAADLVQRLPEMIERVQERLPPQVLRQLRQMEPGTLLPEGTDAATGAAAAVRFGLTLFDMLLLFFLTPVVTFFLLRDWPKVLNRSRDLLPRRSAPMLKRLFAEMHERLAGFLRGQFMVAVALAVFYAVGLFAVGLNYAILVGVLSGLLNLIPVIGNFVTFAIALAIAFAQFDSMLRVAMVVGVYALAQALESGLLQPRLVGGRINLHPVWVIFALLVGAHLFGFVGALLAMPVAAVSEVLVRYGIERYRDSSLYRDA